MKHKAKTKCRHAVFYGDMDKSDDSHAVYLACPGEGGQETPEALKSKKFQS